MDADKGSLDRAADWGPAEDWSDWREPSPLTVEGVPTNTTVTIPSRFCGPPGSGNGGYSCGVLAREFGQNPAEVSLLAPPPLDRPLDVVSDVGQMRMFDGDQLIAVAQRADEPEAGPVVSADEAAAAAAEFDSDQYVAGHAYPMCFACGPGRAEGEGLRLWPGQTATPGVVAWPWVPHPTTSDGTGIVDAPIVWAALDCPSGHAWFSLEPDLTPIVLGRLRAVIHRRPAVAERVVAVGWTRDASGRKRVSGSSLRTESGDLLAAAEATWIVLTEEQRAAFESAV